MATISTSLTLYDGVSGPLKAVQASVNSTIGTFDSMQDAMSQSLNTAPIDNAATAADSMQSELESAAQAADAMNSALAGAGDTQADLQGAAAAADTLEDALNGAGTAAEAIPDANVDGLQQSATKAASLRNILSTLTVTVTQLLSAVRQAATAITQSLGRLETAMQQAFDAGPVEDAAAAIDDTQTGLEDAAQAADSLESNLSSVESGTAGAADEADGLADNIQTANSKAESLESTLKSCLSAITSMVAIKEIFSAVSSLADLSDTETNTTARLSMIVDDEGSVDELEAKIRQMAENTRADYYDTADAIASMGINAGSAFETNDELIAFMEQVNKLFTIGGATAEGQSAAMLQLTQAMASGALRGEELNSILENAPGIARAIEEYMGVAEGTIKDYASEGLVTAEVVKNALFAAAEETNEAFESMPQTWESLWTSFKNSATEALSPVLQQISDLANSTAIQNLITIGINAVTVLANALSNIFTALGNVATWIIENFNVVMEVVTVVGTLLIAYAAATAASWAVAHAPILILIAALAMAIDVVQDMGATFSDVCSVIGGVFGWLYAFIVNTFVMPLWNVMAAIANFIGNCFNDPVAAIKILFWEMAQTVVEMIENMVNAIISLINLIPGVEIGVVDGASGFIQDQIDSIAEASGWTEYVASMDAVDYNDMIEAGADLGSQIGSYLDDLTLDFSSILEDWDTGTEAEYSFDDIYSSAQTFDEISTNTADTASGVSSVADALDITNEELEYLRDIAEREAINRYTTAEVRVEQYNTNNISSEVDVDGIINAFAADFAEKLAISGEGVYA